MARNTIFNFIGYVAPMFVAVFAIPILIRGLGIERFGILNLAWMILGYFSLFDFGLSRALTKIIAEKLGADLEGKIPSLISTAMLLLIFLGVVGTVALCLLSSWLVQDVFKIPPLLHHETIFSFYLLAFSIPVVISTSGLRGVLEAYQRFALINAIRIPMGIVTFLGPLLVLSFSQSLFPVVLVLTIFRVAAWIVHLKLCFMVMPSLRGNIFFKKDLIKPLISYGGWMTVSNIVSPIMTNIDRFLIGAMVSISAVAFYATPYEVVNKLWFIPGAMVGVLFPAFSTSSVKDPSHAELLFDRGVKYTFISIFPITIVIVLFAHEGLNFWLGSEFALQSTFVLQWLSIGVLLNCLAQIPFAFLQGLGRPDITAKLHIIELPFSLLALWLMISTAGIKGAAIAWVLRVAIDASILFGVVYYRFLTKPLLSQRILLIIGVFICILPFVTISTSMNIKVFEAIIIISVFSLVAWFFILDSEERLFLKNPIGHGRNQKA